MASADANEQRSLDPRVWKACAGTTVQIPTVGSRVYYFPQGHAEQSSSPPDLSSVSCTKPYSLCRISGVKFLANQDTDEVFAKISLDPRISPLYSAGSGRPSSESSSLEDPDEDGVVAFSKILTPSDANNGGGFSVPRFLADSIFPELDYKADPPVQTISVRDVQGTAWVFRHIYRGTPRRHLLTTGWSKFVNCKKLVAGDSVVFMKNQSGELFVGVRRTERSCGPSDYLRYSPQGVKFEETLRSGEGFSRNVRGRVSPDSVVEAIRLMEMDYPFEVVYYPRAGLPDFVVRAEMVEVAMGVYWKAGMRVKMLVETDDSSRTTWFQGVVSCATVPDQGPWACSPWRMLQVTWDEPEVLQNVKSLSPWQVELVSTSPQIHTPYPAMKKLRVPQNLEGESNMFFPMVGFSNSIMGNLTPSPFSYNTFPAGMQGARHDPIGISSLSNLLPSNPHRMYFDYLFGNNMPQKFTDVSTEMNIGSISQSESSSPPSHDSMHYHGKELFGTMAHNPTRKASSGSFQWRLFGQTIQIQQPLDGDVEVTENTAQVELLNSLDIQHQRVEACFL